MAGAQTSSSQRPAQRLAGLTPPWQSDPIRSDKLRRQQMAEARFTRSFVRVRRMLEKSYSAKSIDRLLDDVMALFSSKAEKTPSAKDGRLGKFKQLTPLSRHQIPDRMSGPRMRAPVLGNVDRVPSPAAIRAAKLEPPLNPDRPKNGAGAVSFHFEYRTINRGDGAEDGKAASHQRYITRGTEKVIEEASVAISTEGLKSIREGYLARDGAIEMIKSQYVGGPYSPQESRLGFAMVGNLGSTPKDRAYFWRSVEQIEPRNLRGVVRFNTNLAPDQVRTFLTIIKVPPTSYVQNSSWTTVKVENREAGERLINALKDYARKVERTVRINATFDPAKSGRIQHRIIAELAHELTGDQRFEVIKRFTQEQFESRSFPYFAVLHVPSKTGDNRNYHAHIDFYDRPCAVGADGYWDFEDPKTRQPKDREASRMGWVMQLRRAFAETQNTVLAEANLPKRYFAESYAKAHIDQEPTEHLGPKVYALESQGVQTSRGSLAAWKEFFKNDVSRKARNAEKEIWSTIETLGLSKEEILFHLEEREARGGRAADQTQPIIELACDYVQVALADEAYREERRQEQNKAARLLGTLDFRERNLKQRIAKFEGQPIAKPRKGETEADVRASHDFRIVTMKRQLKQIPEIRAETKLRHEAKWLKLEMQKPQMDQLASYRARLEYFLAPSRDAYKNPITGERRIVFTSTFDRVTDTPAYDETLTRSIANANIGNVCDDSAVQIACQHSIQAKKVREHLRRITKPFDAAEHKAKENQYLAEARASLREEIDAVFGPKEEAARLQSQEETFQELLRETAHKQALIDRTKAILLKGFEVTDIDGNLIEDDKILKGRAGGRQPFDKTMNGRNAIRKHLIQANPDQLLDDYRNAPKGDEDPNYKPPPEITFRLTDVERRAIIAHGEREMRREEELARVERETRQALEAQRAANAGRPAITPPSESAAKPISITILREETTPPPQEPPLYDRAEIAHFRSVYRAPPTTGPNQRIAEPDDLLKASPEDLQVTRANTRRSIGSAANEAPDPATWDQLDVKDVFAREMLSHVAWKNRQQMLLDGKLPDMPRMITAIDADWVRPAMDADTNQRTFMSYEHTLSPTQFAQSLQHQGFNVSVPTVAAKPWTPFGPRPKDVAPIDAAEQAKPKTYSPGPGMPAPTPSRPATPPTISPTSPFPAKPPVQEIAQSRPRGIDMLRSMLADDKGKTQT